MESLKTVVIIFLLATSISSKEKIQKVVYLKNIFGHVHQNPMKYSTSLSTISCGHPIKVINQKNENWYYAKVGPYEGYVQINQTSNKKIKCFQDQYPRFFDQLDLEVTDFYYWGKLHDQLLKGRSRVK